jgi:hypothetical protein
VAQYRVDGLTAAGWRNLARGSTIGYRRLQPVIPTLAQRVRVVIEAAVVSPRPLRIGLHSGESLPA